MKRLPMLAAALALSFIYSGVARAEEGGAGQAATTETMTGLVSKSDQSIPRIKVGAVIYLMAASAKADQNCKDTLNAIAQGTAKGYYIATIDGKKTDASGQNWLSVVQLTKKAGGGGDGEGHGDGHGEGDGGKRKKKGHGEGEGKD